ncbi:MAG: methyl-accepting chemotaxis protein [Alphaproteobacteria bacterium]|nr:methyl-accepting chemotaxis protein [Alphaproteobacteria bacterium]
MRIGARIGAGYAAIVVVTGLLGGAGWWALDRYAASVDQAEAMRMIADDVTSARLKVAEYQVAGAPDAVESVFVSLTAGLEKAQAVGAEGIVKAIADFDAAFKGYVDLSDASSTQSENMNDSANRLETAASRIRNLASERLVDMRGAREQASIVQQERMATSIAADEMVGTSLRAQRDEAQYRVTLSTDDADVARESIKKMFLSVLSLKRMSSSDSQAAAITKLAKSVGTYRKTFENLTEAPRFSADATTAMEELRKSARQIDTFASVIGDREVKAYDEARIQGERAQQSVETAMETMSLATELVAQVRSLQIAQKDVEQSQAAPEFVQAVNDRLVVLNATIVGLEALVDDTQAEESLAGLRTAADNYEAAFGESIAAMFSKKQAAVDMEEASSVVLTETAARIESFGDSREADGDLARAMLITGTLVAVLLAIGIAVLLARSLVRPIGSMTTAMQSLADNDLSVEVPGLDRSDEIADMARAVQVFKENAERVNRLEAEEEQRTQKAEQEKRRAMTELADHFEGSVGGVVRQLISFAQDVRTRAENMKTASNDAGTRATECAGSSEQSSANVQAVSAAAEELAATVHEIGRQVGQAATMAKQASDETSRGDAQVKALAETAARIGDVITLIQDIAAQTNLLALNATIEAARAGEAGKGFAVVANEVKSLASQTAKATDDIRVQIEQVQAASDEVVLAIGGIGSAVAQLDELNAAVASAVEEQGATTQEIARNTQEAAQGTQQVTNAISEVSNATVKTGQDAGDVLQMCGTLSDSVDTLEREVDSFLTRVRSS